MSIKVEIIADSVSASGNRLTTMRLRYPRVIHAEFMTHRMFSRNASSSRAIPVERLIQDVMDDPFIPSYWLANKPGMQGGAEHDADVNVTFPCKPSGGTDYPGWLNLKFDPDDHAITLERDAASPRGAWLCARDLAVMSAKAFAEAGYHKQIVNRLLEPFAHITVVVTATEWENFFQLRDHDDAEPHIRDLARSIRACFATSTPQKLGYGDWHLPFVESSFRPGRYGRYFDGEVELQVEDALKVSVARCARTSYTLHDGKPSTIEADIALYEKLVGSRPLHASPAEHQAECVNDNIHSGNFRGNWMQYRTVLEAKSWT